MDCSHISPPEIVNPVILVILCDRASAAAKGDRYSNPRVTHH
ncbi:hypothetical protein PN447_01380 [Anabaena sp. CS-542/02]|nr:hypothetical protein [Anabaena sp. CS-542/02]